MSVAGESCSDVASIDGEDDNKLMVIRGAYPVGNAYPQNNRNNTKVHFQLAGHTVNPEIRKFGKINRANSARQHRIRSADNRTKSDHSYFSDASFENRQLRFYTLKNNGIRPHGGTYGAEKMPPEVNSVNRQQFEQTNEQSAENQQIENELKKSNRYISTHTPTYAFEAKNQVLHSGKFPLFAQELLPVNKLEQQHSNSQPFFYRRLAQHERRLQSAPARARNVPQSKKGTRFYKPNTTHQYLTDVELRNYAEKTVKLELGKPTRAQLLRQRHRLGEPPVNRSLEKQQIRTRLEKMRDTPVPTSARSITDMTETEVPVGETPDSFLLGARYNRAHCLDMNVFYRYGVYLPRNADCPAFVVNARNDQLTNSATPLFTSNLQDLSESVRVAVTRSQQRVLEAAEKSKTVIGTESLASPRRPKTALIIQGRSLGRSSTGNPITDTLQANLLAQYDLELEESRTEPKAKAEKQQEKPKTEVLEHAREGPSLPDNEQETSGVKATAADIHMRSSSQSLLAEGNPAPVRSPSAVDSEIKVVVPQEKKVKDDVLKDDLVKDDKGENSKPDMPVEVIDDTGIEDGKVDEPGDVKSESITEVDTEK